ncbi:MAG: HPr(Ser) kinase/phosphatase [Opitutaceae bacterium]|nr:HPr(Ser) kinase/phosphatase [Opitutaceae bacterium]
MPQAKSTTSHPFPAGISAPPSGITVAHFYEANKEKLKLDLAFGERGLGRMIEESTINRPALALTGFFKYFAHRRVQVLGAAEWSFMKTQTLETQTSALQEMVRRGIPCIVLTRNYHPTPPMIAVAEDMSLPLLRTPMITFNWINLATLALDNEFAPRGQEHATTLDIKGVGVMIRGDSGVGKSECALALIERGHSLVADDLTLIRLVDEREIMASSRELNRGYMECRGIGIINIEKMFGIKSVRLEKRIDMVVTLREWKEGVEEERTGLEQNTYPLLDRKMPHVELYVRPGRDIARLVEVAALTHALRKIGHDPAVEFNERLIAHMARQQAEAKPTRIRPVEREEKG